MMGVLKFQMLILPSLIYRIDLTSVKIPASYWVPVYDTIMMDMKVTHLSKSIEYTPPGVEVLMKTMDFCVIMMCQCTE